MAKPERIDNRTKSSLPTSEIPSQTRMFNRLRQILSPAPLTTNEPTIDSSSPYEGVCHTAKRLDEIEERLLRRIALISSTDRETDRLVCRLKIVTNRLRAQLEELRDE